MTNQQSPPAETPRALLWSLHRSLASRLLREIQDTSLPVSAATLSVARLFLLDNGIYVDESRQAVMKGLEPLNAIELDQFDDFSLTPINKGKH